MGNIAYSGRVVARAAVVQRKTRQPVRFKLTEQTRDALEAWIAQARLCPDEYLIPSRLTRLPPFPTRQCARIVKGWVASIGLGPADHGTHSLRRTKATLIYRRTNNLRAVQLLLGHTKLEGTVRCLGIEVDDALKMAEQTDVQTPTGRGATDGDGRFPAMSGQLRRLIARSAYVENSSRSLPRDLPAASIPLWKLIHVSS